MGRALEVSLGDGLDPLSDTHNGIGYSRRLAIIYRLMSTGGETRIES